MADRRQPPWARTSGESPQAFTAFAAYRDLGPSRSTRKVAQELSKSGALIARWSAAHDWVRRAAAWDADQDRRMREAQQAEAAEIGRRHARIVEEQIEALQAPAAELLRRLHAESHAL